MHRSLFYLHCVVTCSEPRQRQIYRKTSIKIAEGSSISVLIASPSLPSLSLPTHGALCGAACNLPTAVALLGKIRERGINAGSEGLDLKPYGVLERRRSRRHALQVGPHR